MPRLPQNSGAAEGWCDALEVGAPQVLVAWRAPTALYIHLQNKCFFLFCFCHCYLILKEAFNTQAVILPVQMFQILMPPPATTSLFSS